MSPLVIFFVCPAVDLFRVVSDDFAVAMEKLFHSRHLYSTVYCRSVKLMKFYNAIFKISYSDAIEVRWMLQLQAALKVVGQVEAANVDPANSLDTQRTVYN